MTTTSDDRIARLEQALAEHRPAVLAALRRPGATPAELDAFEQRTGLRLPPPVRCWLERIGGEQTPTERLIDNWSAISLAQIESAWEVCQSVFVADPLGERQKLGAWDRDWLPLLTNGGGDYLCVDLAGTLDGPAGQMLTYYHDEDYRIVGAESFERWLELVIAATIAAPDDPWLPREASRSVRLGFNGSAGEDRRRRSDMSLGTGSLRFEPRPLDALGSAGLDDEMRAFYPQLDNGVCLLLRTAAEHARTDEPAPPLTSEMRKIGTAYDGHPIERLTLREPDGKIAVTLDEGDRSTIRALADGRVVVVGYADVWLLRRATRSSGWIPLERLAVPKGSCGDRVRWLDDRHAALIDDHTEHHALLLEVDGARLRWRGRVPLPPMSPAALADREIAQVGPRLFAATGDGTPGGELFELVGLDE